MRLENTYILFGIQDASRNHLAPREQHSYRFSVETSKATIGCFLEFDELYLALCCASLVYHNRMPPSNIRYLWRFSDLLDETVYILTTNPCDFFPLKEVVLNTLSRVNMSLGSLQFSLQISPVVDITPILEMRYCWIVTVSLPVL